VRHPIVALVLALFFAIGLGPATAEAAAGDELKVVIIVGPVDEPGESDRTSSYRASAKLAYDEAMRYTSNVTKVYSPYATWSKVKAATAGASIVVYLGHGNGWPSPWTYDPNYTTKNGFGLNATAGNGDANHVYYGEPYVSGLELAPNAVIILNRLCYASGNSESETDHPTQSVARQRVSNYAAGFLKAGVAAVIAEGHGSAVPYIRSLFTTNQTILDAWRSAPSNGNELSFASTRTSGVTAYTDTETSTKGYYRSLVTRPGKTTGDVRAGADSPFVDIATSGFVPDITWLYDAGITKGCSTTRYCPSGNVTRGQMASFMARSLELPAATDDYFGDDDGSTHEADINRIAGAGLTEGCDAGAYCSTAVVTRGQMASFLARALELPVATSDYFSDDDGSTHEADINRIAEAGITNGCGGVEYCSTSAVTRGQMAAFLHRAFGS